MNTNYSLIIPYYNNPRLLLRLLSTVPRRHDLQVIVVDDFSDRGIDDFNNIKSQFYWIEWYRTSENRGGGHARNLGLEKASGNWIIFADCDDFFLPSFNLLLDLYSTNISEDIIFFDAISVDSESYKISKRNNHLSKMIDGCKNNVSKAELSLRYLFGEPWGKIIKRQLIMKHNIRFDETRIHNDTKFSYMIGFYAKNIKIEDLAVYCITERSQSVSKLINLDKLIIRIKIFAEKNKFLSDHHIKVFDPILLGPFNMTLKSLDFKLFNKILKTYNSLGYSFFKLLKLNFYKKVGLKIQN